MADDTVENLQLLTNMLKSQGYETRPVPSHWFVNGQRVDNVLGDTYTTAPLTPADDGMAIAAELYLAGTPNHFCGATSGTMSTTTTVNVIGH